MYRNFLVDRHKTPQTNSLVLTGLDARGLTLRHYAPGMDIIGVITSDTYSAAPQAGGISFRVEGF